MSPEMKIISGIGFVLLLIIVAVLFKFLPKRLKHDKFTEKWRYLQDFCRDRATWEQAIKMADKLLDEALKKRKFKGKTMGERLVSAGGKFTNNDAVWFAHNLVKKMTITKETKLTETEVKQALVGFRQALRDLGALPGITPETDIKEQEPETTQVRTKKGKNE